MIHKTSDEQDIDNIVGKKILQHLKHFFYEKNDKTYKRKSYKSKSKAKNKTLKRSK